MTLLLHPEAEADYAEADARRDELISRTSDFARLAVASALHPGLGRCQGIVTS